MSMLGVNDTLNDASVCAQKEAFTCHLYGKPDVTSIDEARYRLFCTKPIQSSSLPPCSDALKHHMMRANYQAHIWRNALVAQTTPPLSPHKKGWTIDDGCLHVMWLTKPPAPDALMLLISCRCTTGCSSQRCSCRSNLLLCTDICGCKDCTNAAGVDNDDADGDIGPDSNDSQDSDIDLD